MNFFIILLLLVVTISGFGIGIGLFSAIIDSPIPDTGTGFPNLEMDVRPTSSTIPVIHDRYMPNRSNRSTESKSRSIDKAIVPIDTSFGKTKRKKQKNSKYRSSKSWAKCNKVRYAKAPYKQYKQWKMAGRTRR